MRFEHIDTPVVILRMDHHGALGVIRSLGRLGVAVYGVHRSRDALALRSRYARGGFVWDLDAEPVARSVERLLAIASELGRRPILIPSNDETALFLAENAEPLHPAFRFQENRVELVRTLYDKKSMYFLARELGIPTAETFFPRDRGDVRAFAADARFPLMLKGSDGIRLSLRTGRKMVIVHRPAELLELYERMEDLGRPDLMLQEYIPGGEDAQWMFNGLFDADSECRFAITARKLRQSPVYTGMTSLGVCMRNDEVEALTRRFMRAIGYRGILDIGYRFDARDRTYKVLDVNPRLGATFRLFVGENGLDVVRALYLDLTGQPVPPSQICEGRRWFVEDLDFASSIRYHRDGLLDAREWLRSFGGVRESAWFARDDLRPFAGMCGRCVAQAGRRLGKSLGIAPAPDARLAAEAHHAEVTRHFARSATSWKRVPEEERLEPMIYRERHAAALRWVESVALPTGAQVLEVGCGAGHTSVALAQRGYRVHALDATPEMIALTRTAAGVAGVPHFTAAVGDVHDLAFSDGTFDLVVALGVLPWLYSEVRGLGEMARVLRPGGWLIVTADNPAPLHRLLDPRSMPALAPVRWVARKVLGRARAEPSDAPSAKKHEARSVDRLVRSAGLEKVKSTTVGFGPFSLLGRKLLSDPADLRVQHQLQRLARARWPLFRSTGAHYVLLARKPAG